MLRTVLKQWRWGYSCVLYYGAFQVESYLALYSYVLVVLFSIVITSLGEERAGIYASRAFVTFILHALFSVPFLRLMIVTLPGLFSNFFLFRLISVSVDRSFARHCVPGCRFWSRCSSRICITNHHLPKSEVILNSLHV